LDAAFHWPPETPRLADCSESVRHSAASPKPSLAIQRLAGVNEVRVLDDRVPVDQTKAEAVVSTPRE